MTDFDADKWIGELADKYTPQVRLIYLRTVKANGVVDETRVQGWVRAVTRGVLKTASEKMGLTYDETNAYYESLIQIMSNQLSTLLNGDIKATHRKVRTSLPKGTSKAVTDALKAAAVGLNNQQVATLIRQHQFLLAQPRPPGEKGLIRQLSITARNMKQSRANNISTTETARIINNSVQGLWHNNPASTEGAQKQLQSYRTSKHGICGDCKPLLGLTIPLNERFHTSFGSFSMPPFHPHCCCIAVLILPNGTTQDLPEGDDSGD